MPVADILLLEPDLKTREVVAQTIGAMFYNVVVSASLEQAVRRVREGDLEAVIADWRTLAPSAAASPENPLSLANRLRAAMAQLRTQHAASAESNAAAPTRQLQIIVTSSQQDPSIHAAAISAGADAYLRTEDVLEPAVLESYLAQVVERAALARQAAAIATVPAIDQTVTPVESGVVGRPARGTTHLVDAFELDDASLRDATSGRWSAKQVADELGVTLRALAEAVDVNYSTMAKTPDSVALQERLAPFANVIAMLRQVYGGDLERVRKWLNAPQAALKDATPLEAMLRPGMAPAVEQWVAGVWLGDGA